MLVADHLQPAALKAGISGQVGFHTLQRTLAFLTLWKYADPDIPILKQAKPEYAKLQ
jgi:hypothetical protein